MNELDWSNLNQMIEEWDKLIMELSKKENELKVVLNGD